MSQRIGFGYDSHRFGADRPLRLGGEILEHTSGLIGHSDADAVAHAIIDALLGAAAMGDIGRLFPDAEAAWANANSMKMLKEVRRRLDAASYQIVNIDCTVVMQAPKLAPYVDAMRDNIATALDILVGSVSIKGKTNEQMDAVGAGQGVAVYAVATLAGA